MKKITITNNGETVESDVVAAQVRVEEKAIGEHFYVVDALLFNGLVFKPIWISRDLDDAMQLRRKIFECLQSDEPSLDINLWTVRPSSLVC